MDYKLGDCFTVEKFYVSDAGKGIYACTKLNANTTIATPQRGVTKSSRYR